MNKKLLTAISALLLTGGVGIAMAGSTVELMGVAERDSVVEKYDINEEYEEFLFKAEALAKKELTEGSITPQDYAETVDFLSQMTIDEFVLTKSMVNSEAKKSYKNGIDMSDAGVTAIATGIFPMVAGVGLLFAIEPDERKKENVLKENTAEQKQLD